MAQFGRSSKGLAHFRIQSKEAHTDLSVGQILGYINQLLIDWHIMPYLTVMLILVSVIGTIVLIRRLWIGS